MLDTASTATSPSGTQGRQKTDTPGSAVWQVAPGVCALADGERHLGHAFHEGTTWVAYDAVHVNASGDGFLCLGHYQTMDKAKSAIENSVSGWGFHREIPQSRPY